MLRRFVTPLLLLAMALPAREVSAGGGPLNVLVVFNADVPEAVDVADHYATARDLPTSHRCAVTGVDPTLPAIPFTEYESLILTSVEACLAMLPTPGEIDYLVLVRGLPYRVDLEGANAYSVSLSAALQILRAGRVSDGAPLAGTPQAMNGGVHIASINNPAYLDGNPAPGDYVITNPSAAWYGGATSIVRAANLPPSFRRFLAGSTSGYAFADNLFIVTRLDGFDFDDAHDLIDRGLAADGTFPTADILCMEAADEARGARDPECEFTARHLSMAFFNAEYLSPHDNMLAGRNLVAYFTGSSNLRMAIDGNSYVPGAIAENLTSFGAMPVNFACDATGTTCPEMEAQTSIARFVRAGVTGVHGTVAEPLNNCFPGAGTLLLYSFGYNLGESFFFNQRYLYWQNLILGDPLASPFAERPEVTFESVGEIPLGEPLRVSATHPDGVVAIRLYVDETLVFQSLGEPVEWPVDGDVGGDLAVMAIAFAANAPQSRPGWPNPDQMPQPDVQGWAFATITVGEALPPPPPPPPPPPMEEGCACRMVGRNAGETTTGPAGLVFGALLLMGMRRRRRSA